VGYILCVRYAYFRKRMHLGTTIVLYTCFFLSFRIFNFELFFERAAVNNSERIKAAKVRSIGTRRKVNVSLQAKKVGLSNSVKFIHK